MSLLVFCPIRKMLHISNENRFLYTKNGGTVEVTLCGRVLVGLQNRLRGPILCSKKTTTLYIICILDPPWPSCEVGGHFKPPLCRFSIPSLKCYVFLTKTRFLPGKNWGCSEVLLASLSLIGLKNRPCVPLLCSKNSACLYIICIWDPFGPSHEVEGHFKPPLCRCSITSFPFM